MFRVCPDETPLYQFQAETRVLGRFTGDLPGPTIIATAGIHGNEPAGVAALIRVIEELQRLPIPFRGQIHAIAGNLKALKHNLRFIDTDLNRMFVKNRSKATAEDEEKIALEAEIQKIMEITPGPHLYLDLHTTSAEGPPFCLLSESKNHETKTTGFPVPQILGLIRLIPGTLAHMMVENGVPSFVFEGGQHRVPKTLRHMIHGIWLFLAEVGCIRPEDLVDLVERSQEIAHECVGLPRFLSVKYRHPVSDGDEFLMKPGFSNFDPVEAGQLLAWDKRGEIRAPLSGRILMPLYQGQGTDGFFLGVGLDKNRKPE